MNSRKIIIGRADQMDLPEYGLVNVTVKVDTGAKTSAMWASNICERDGGLAFTLFGPESPFYTGDELFMRQFEQVAVSSSIGEEEVRYKVRFLISVRGRRIRASFTLADRSRQAYPVLIGRNALRGKFLVDVQSGKPDYKAEQRRSVQLRHKREQEQ